MKIMESSGSHETSGNVEEIDAFGKAVITHKGDSKFVRSKDRSSITVHGSVSNSILAAGHSVVLAWGNPKLVSATERAKIAVYGSPSNVVAKGDSAITVLGEPKELQTWSTGKIIVISLIDGYTPEGISSVFGGEVEVYNPGSRLGDFTRHKLGFDLEALFGQTAIPPIEGTEYLAYLALSNS